MPLAFPSTPAIGQVYQNWWWDGSKWMSRARSAPRCGIFQLVGSSPSTTVQFIPYNGDLIKLNGSIVQIPQSGISAPVNGCYINGVVGALAANTLYYVYAWMNGATLALDFSATGYAASTTASNVGTQIKSGDDTRTLVGMVSTNGTPAFANGPNFNGIRSWFNRQIWPVSNSWSGSGVGAGVTPVTVVAAVMFTGETFYNQSVFTISSGIQQAVYCDHVLDGGTATLVRATPSTDVGIYHCTTVVSAYGPVTSGYHYVQGAMWAQQQTVGSSSVFTTGYVT